MTKYKKCVDCHVKILINSQYYNCGNCSREYCEACFKNLVMDFGRAKGCKYSSVACYKCLCEDKYSDSVEEHSSEDSF